MDVFALDFDGVICDSVHETALTSWYAGREIWPMEALEDPPQAYLRRFVTLRPLVETGYQAVLLMGLIVKGLSDQSIASGFEVLCDQLLRETACSPEQLATVFGYTREQWIARDLRGWLGQHRFYPWVLEPLACRVEGVELFIVTTKQERFVQTLFEGYNIKFPAEHIFGLDTGRKKEDVLEELLARAEFRAARWHFVEDRLATLMRVAARDSLRNWHLYLVDWGYNTVTDREVASSNPAISLWSPEHFLVV